MSEVNINHIRERFISKIKNTGWSHILDPIILSPEFDILISKLKTEVDNDRRFTPKLKYLFNAFIHCPYKDLKVVFVGQDPYPQIDVADGIAFSCSLTGKAQPSLRYIFQELNGSQWDSLDPDLSRWSKQGVLMLNTALTVQIGKIGSHYSLWKDIMTQILTAINTENKDLVVALLGKKAEEWETHFNSHNQQKVFKVAHPASAAYKGGNWNSDNLFKKINNQLNKHNKKQIKWD
jgi:uracil-DNA glycosylase